VLVFACCTLNFAAAPQTRNDDVHGAFAGRALELDGVTAAFACEIAGIDFWIWVHCVQTSTSILLGCKSCRKAYGVRVSHELQKWPLGRPRLHVVNGEVNRAVRQRRQPWNLWLAAAAIALHFTLRPLLDSWLNASSDKLFFAALVILALPLLLAAYAFYRSIRGKRHS
jgi:hypothetical protein